MYGRKIGKLKKLILLSNKTLFSVHVTGNLAFSSHEFKTEEIGIYFWFHIFQQKLISIF